MDQKIFRKASLERIQSPEQLNTYIRVTNVNVWLVLSGIVLILVGFLVWGIFGKITTEISVPVMVTQGQGTFFLPEENLRSISENMTMNVEGKMAEVRTFSREAVQLGENAFMLPGLKPGQVCYWGNFPAAIADGIYEGTLIAESIHPIELILK